MVLFFIVCSSFVLANKISIDMRGRGESKNSFLAGEDIAFTISLYDENNNPVSDNVDVIIENADKTETIEKTFPSNQPVSLNLGESARAGFWSITAKYQDAEITSLFSIEPSGNVLFEIIEDRLIITNTGNSRYTETIDIAIGDSIKSQDVDLGVGDKTSFRLVAPDGTYNIRVTDGKTTVTKGSVTLTGTGNVIGVLDERLTGGEGPITGGPGPGEEGEDFYGGRNKNLVYLFIIVVIGAAVLLAIERNYRKRI